MQFLKTYLNYFKPELWPRLVTPLETREHEPGESLKENMFQIYNLQE